MEGIKLDEKLLEFGNRLAFPPSSADDLYSLLDQIDTVLSRVEQSPPSSTLTALEPLMKKLAVKELLRHPDMDVKAAVASCTSEITRITAPEAPYNDDIMKEIFQMIVGAFEALDETSCRSFQKRVSVLETVAKVRSCVVMLDLECDALILEMFQHFLKTIREAHPKNVFASMEAIMSLVIEESEDISSDLLSCLLDTVKHDNKGVLPIARDLVEKVIINCADKIKPCILEFLQSSGAPLGKYGKVVASICRGTSEDSDNNDAQGSGEVLADDSKLSERTVSDELPEGSGKFELDEGSAERVDAPANTSPLAATSNGAIQMGSGNSMEEPSSPRQKSERSRRSGQPRNAVAGRGDADNLESAEEKRDYSADPKKAKGRKTNSSVVLLDMMDRSRVDTDKEVPTVTSRRGGCTKEAATGSHVHDEPAKEAEQRTSEHENKEPENLPVSDNPTSVVSPTPTNPVRNKRGRRPSKTAAKQRDVDAVADKPSSASGGKDSLANSQADVVKDGESPREGEDAAANKEPAAVMSDSEAKQQRSTVKRGRSKKSALEQSSGSNRKSGRKSQKKESTIGDVAGKSSSKEMTTSPRSASKVPSADVIHQEDIGKPKSRRKRARDKDDTPEASNRKNKLGGNLVGSKIKVWWPDDAAFYEGVVETFIAESKKHRIVYNDGDVEILALKDERWEFVDNDPEKEESKQNGWSASELSSNKKLKASSDASLKTKSSESQLKSDTETGSQEAVKRKIGRPRKLASPLAKVPQNDSPRSPRKPRGKASSELNAKAHKSRSKDGPENEPGEGTPGTSTKREDPKDETPIADANKIDTPKFSGKSKGKLGRPPKARTPNTSNTLKDDISKGSKSHGEGSSKARETPKSTSRVEDVSATGTSHTPKTTKSKTPNSNPKSNGDSKVKIEVKESPSTAGLDGSGAATGGTGSKRKRNRRK